MSALKNMTKSDSSLGLFFPSVDSAKEGSAGALQFCSGHEWWMVFLPSLPPAPPVSKESAFHLTSCFFATMQPNDSQIPWEWPEDDANVGMGMGPWFITMGPGPDPGLWSWTLLLQQMTAGASPGVGHLVYMLYSEHHQDSSFWMSNTSRRACDASLPKALIPSLPCPRPPLSVRALRAETA